MLSPIRCERATRTQRLLRRFRTGKWTGEDVLNLVCMLMVGIPLVSLLIGGGLFVLLQ